MHSPRALDSSEYATVLSDAGVRAQAFDRLKDALDSARQAAKEDNVPLVCLGSLYVYADLMNEMEK